MIALHIFLLGILPFLSEEITHHNIRPMILRYPKLPKNINDTKDLPLAILMEGNLHQKNSFSSKGIPTDMFIHIHSKTFFIGVDPSKREEFFQRLFQKNITNDKSMTEKTSTRKSLDSKSVLIEEEFLSEEELAQNYSCDYSEPPYFVFMLFTLLLFYFRRKKNIFSCIRSKIQDK